MPSIVNLPPERMSPARRLLRLARELSAEEAVPVLLSAASAPDASTADRVGALYALRTLSPPREDVLALVRDPQPQVRRAALAVIEQIGDQAALDALMTTQPLGDAASDRRLDLARALIAHRLGEDYPRLSEAAPLDRDLASDPGAVDLAFHELSSAETSARFASLVSGGYGLQPSPLAHRMTCARGEYVVFVARQVESDPDWVLQRPRLAAVVGYVLGGRPAVQFVVLSTPTGSGAGLEVVRTDGEVSYVGSVWPADGRLKFSVADVGRPGTAPTTVAGVLAPSIRLERGTTVAGGASGRQSSPVNPQ